mgnify:CR=1 FL=1
MAKNGKDDLSSLFVTSPSYMIAVVRMFYSSSRDVILS